MATEKERYFIRKEADSTTHHPLGSPSFVFVDVTDQVEEWKEKAWRYDELH